MNEKLDQILTELHQQYIHVWEDVCNIESPTNHKAGVDAVGTYFINMAKERGWGVEIFEQPVAGNVVTITLNPHVQKAPLSISAHMDTVHPVGSFGTPAVHFADGKIYGPGVTDCKGGAVAAFYAMDVLDRLEFRDRPVCFYLQSDEEGGGKYSGDATIRHICEQAKGSVAFLNLEGGSVGKACLIRKGIATFTFTVKGIEAHAAACATSGANAILEAAYKIIELEKLKDPKGLTCCCAVIKGGTTHNTVAGLCEFKANVRFANAEQLAWMEQYAKEVAETTHVEGCTCTVVLPRVRPALEECDRNTKLLESLNGIWEKNGMEPLVGISSLGGSDAANVSTYGIPAIDNLGPVGGKVHTLDEYGIVSSLQESAKRIALAAMYL